MDLPSPISMRPEAGRYRAAPGLVSALILLACVACRMASLPRGESVAVPVSASPAPARHAADSAVLRVVGQHFVGPDGRVVLLRGVNLGGDGKLPPFLTPDDPVLLDRLTELGFNAIRLLFIWEAYEPEPGRYDEAYLTRLVAVAATAWARGLYVIIDIHQDGFARTLSYGCGAGFPLWAISPRATPHPPDNGCGCKGWPLLELTDPGVHRSFADFYADAHGVRTRYLAMLGRVAGAFAAVPGVVGYDPLNEPWGDEGREIAPLYRDAAAALRGRHPPAILFLEGRGPTATGFRTRLPRPGLDNIAFAPHYYNPLAIVRENGGGRTAVIDRAFGRMEAKAAEWGVPLLVGEFGIPGGARRAGDYIDYHYDRLDAALASAMQWTVSARRAPQAGEGWNGEDFSLLDDAGRPRPNYRPRPYPHRVAGVPVCFRFEATAPPRGEPRLEFVWAHRPGLGPTEIVVPAGLFPPGARPRAEPGDATCLWDHSRRLLTCDAPRPATIRVVLESP
jgi:endoglycosylceramidase